MVGMIARRVEIRRLPRRTGREKVTNLLDALARS
jgi:hypothetical protein